MNDKVVIVGTGALATLFAARLAAADCSVTILGTWQAAIDAINQNGINLFEADGRQVNFPVRATNSPTDCRSADLAFVLVKAWQTGRAAGQLAEGLLPASVAVTLQNGLGNKETLENFLGKGRALLGVTTNGATLVSPGIVRVGGVGMTSLETGLKTEAVHDLLQKAGLPVEMVLDANALVWGKLVVSAAINPLTALLRIPNGDLLNKPTAREMMAGLALETASVAAAVGIDLPFTNPVLAAENVARQTAANTSSMLQDVLRGDRTEIDSICGEIVSAGKKYGVETPLNQLMWQLVQAL